ncbi:flagellar biosynthesis protein FlhB [Enterococcus columbae]|uniref:Flagellar biosynthetic protein FlhB n=1 Tax=Enterococcus columbae DSM 7374 = ATCC 51263 TaxID=1121865 RepID=S0KGB9_9ENTE|nr:flagellar biosynthesis protein FlhB [Enterococcus columbae]EOT39995.1 flagellar biosynthetic protein FlhB [Enterococcus columbae DSM 7374 = ATCC 51263]EOW83980.1 flagellar biosynthetic protein FlhB [Enterococcus columbae DSM 7374 = ATCC 51263]OJG25801.1 flagellar biosynthetic protein FlhB [Enterococcus columbae DSM 7374 = ATCC 51263]
MADKDGKTEQPTGKRLSDARQDGNIPKSPDLVTAISLFAFATLLLPLWQSVLRQLIPYMTAYFEQLYLVDTKIHGLARLLPQSILFFFLIILPFLGVSLLLGIVGNFLQVGVLFTSKVLQPKFSKLNPINGFKNMFGLQSLVNLAKSLVKLIVIVYLGYSKLQIYLPTLLNSSEIGTIKTLEFCLRFVHDWALQVSIFLIVVGIGDYLYQRYKHTQSLRMTKEEVKEEAKQAEGDPKIKGQRRAKHREILLNAIKKVKEATVVITNPTHYAIALRYDPDKDEVPLVLAKGQDELAQKIKAEAKEHGVTMIENKPVARALYPLVEPGEYIPVEMYESIAEIIALVYQLEEQKKYKI